MRKEAESRVHLIRSRTNDLDERCRQRLNEELGIDDESIEVILNLRSQIMALQERMRELESMLESYQAGHNSRLIKYRQVIYEADWEDS